ncbi:hypothetical protein CHLRE_04g225500v5 [Chlamydomonas reinhardtii]|uniref:Uncharacterized protein n=1 Tax=Chlamydomonas reinhardtii TaxID=3055 RepID=A0A2K3DUK3_CHLRE|nr:uncharacterized protein CHLRE_04g225500v5 [Chlamydomonas reinhardtii]XP_042925342.1 uncharacterized protein CHLRE_04g225500v5 [Chlamydomonas reinhardtii]PNW84213.1 hypothetical protein CHLRE_04g225500v5 [Chlamydomonas reinhardtii]PNW84214.1 hypothetical protein CHLRE_04g225500v5 [Chlamydomonas reinhardtii]
MGSDKQMDSKSTAKLFKTRVSQHLEGVETPSSSASSSISSSSRQPLAACKLRAKEQNATVVASLRSSRAVLDVLTQLEGRMDSQDRQIRELQAANRELQAATSELQAAQQATNRELQAANSAQQATNRELQATNRELQAEHRELRGRVDMLASQSAAHGLVLLRYVADLVHQKLEQRFDSGEDSRPPDMQYSVWLAALQARHPQYFEQHHLDAPAIQLLHKGRGTLFHAGNLAAHQPPQAHADAALADAVREQLAWNTLWAFVNSPER